jgi:SAM-dependent methyltransferase
MKELNKHNFIVDEIKKLSFSSPGSGAGKLYHEIPFEEFSEFNSARTSNDIRLTKMVENYDFKGKRVLDIGCNIGYFCFKLAEKGAICYGVDYDKDSIKVAKMLQDYKGIQNVNFFNELFDDNFIEKTLLDLGPFDVIILQSVNHWLLNVLNSSKKLVNLMRKLFNEKQIIFYEPSIGNKAFYPEMQDKKEVHKFLNSCGYSDVRNLGRFYTSNIDSKRDYWIGKVDLNDIASKLIDGSNIKPILIKNNRKYFKYKNYFIKAVSLNHPAVFTYENEIKFSIALRGKDYLPYYFTSVTYKNYKLLFYEFVNAVQLESKISLNLFKTYNNIKLKDVMLIQEKSFDILDDLKNNQIIHRDIIPRNILFDRLSKNVFLIDFQLATKYNSEIITSSEHEKIILNNCLELCGNSGRYRSHKNNIFSYETDRDAVKKILYELRKGTVENLVLNFKFSNNKMKLLFGLAKSLLNKIGRILRIK